METDEFYFDPILTDHEYPDLLTAFIELPVVFFSRKHFYELERSEIRDRDKTPYILVAPFANLSLTSLAYQRDGSQYFFTPYYFSKSPENLKKFASYGLEVFDSIESMRHAMFGWMD